MDPMALDDVRRGIKMKVSKERLFLSPEDTRRSSPTLQFSSMTLSFLSSCQKQIDHLVDKTVQL